MGFVQQRSTSSVLPTTCDALLEKVEQNVDNLNIELVDKSLEEEKSSLPKMTAPSVTADSSSYAEAHAVSNTVRFIGSLIDVAIIGSLSEILSVINVLPLSPSSISLIVFVAYYFFLELSFSKTVGKMILGLKVTTKDGDKPDFAAYLTRTLIRLIPFDPMSFLLTPGWHRNEYKGHWHDKWSDTYVVKN